MLDKSDRLGYLHHDERCEDKSEACEIQPCGKHYNSECDSDRSEQNECNESSF